MKIKNLHETSTSTSANFYCGICNLGIWNKEYSSRNPELPQGLDWNQAPSSTDKESEIQYLDPESKIHNSKFC